MVWINQLYEVLRQLIIYSISAANDEYIYNMKLMFTNLFYKYYFIPRFLQSVNVKTIFFFKIVIYDILALKTEAAYIQARQ